MASLDLDPTFSRALRLLHSKSKDSEEQLRIMLDEAIKQSRGGSKGLSNLPITKEVVTKKDVSKSSSSSLSGKKDDFHKDTEKLNPEECSETSRDTGTSKRLKGVEISKSGHSKPLVRGSSSPSSTPSPQAMAIGDILGIIKQEPIIKEEPLVLDDDDDDDDDGLALEILEEDLTCVVCRGMVVVARNQLVECVECHSLYHQECHQPPVSEADMNDPRSAWYCSNCTKDINKMGSGNSSGGKQGTSSTGQAADSQSSYTVSLDGSNGKSSFSGVTAKTDSSSNFSSTSKTFGGLPLSSSKSGSSSSKPAASSAVPAASQKVVLPKINIVSADKRLQIMKKKAAKMQEKKKHSK